MIDAVMPEVVAIRQNTKNQKKQTIKTDAAVMKGIIYGETGESGGGGFGGGSAATTTSFAMKFAPADSLEIDQSSEIPASKASMLRGQESELICAWNPSKAGDCFRGQHGPHLEHVEQYDQQPGFAALHPVGWDGGTQQQGRHAVGLEL